MDFQTFQLHAKTQNKRRTPLTKIKKCRNVSYSCNVKPIGGKISKKTTLVNKLLRLDQKVLSLTKELWKSLLNIVDQAKILSRKNSCFSINDADECKALNTFYFQFNSNFIKLKGLYKDSENGDDDFKLLDNAVELLESFLSQTFPLIEKDIKNLQITIAICRKKGCSEKSFFKENIGKEFNTAIKEYLKKLRRVFARSDHENNISPEIKVWKEKILFEIDRIYRIKRKLYVNGSYEDVNTPDTLVKNDGSENRSNFVTAEDINKETELVYELNTKNTLMNKSEATISPLNGEIMVHDVNENNQPPKHDAFTSLGPEHLNETELAAAENFITFASIVSVVGLLIFLVYFGFRKYKERKVKRHCIDEQEL